MNDRLKNDAIVRQDDGVIDPGVIWFVGLSSQSRMDSVGGLVFKARGGRE